MDFVFHTMMEVAQRGSGEIILPLSHDSSFCVSVTVISVNKINFSVFSLCVSTSRTLDVGNSNMTFGGLRTVESILLHPAQIKTHDFVGCIRNVHVNGILLRPSMALTTYNILHK